MAATGRPPEHRGALSRRYSHRDGATTKREQPPRKQRGLSGLREPYRGSFVLPRPLGCVRAVATQKTWHRQLHRLKIGNPPTAANTLRTRLTSPPTTQRRNVDADVWVVRSSQTAQLQLWPTSTLIVISADGPTGSVYDIDMSPRQRQVMCVGWNCNDGVS